MPATIQDVAKASGVSVGTVSRALNNYPDVSAKTRAKVLEAVRELGYSPNLMAKNLSSKHIQNISVILSGFLEEKMFNGFETILMRGAYEYAEEHGLEVSLYVINGKIQMEKSYEQMCYEHNLAGAILLGLKTTDPYCETLGASRYPCVTIDLEVAGDNVTSVTIDHIAAFKELTQYLIDCGHRKIVLVNGRKNAMVTLERLAGAYEAMEKNGLMLTNDDIIYTNFLREEAYDGVLRYFSEHSPDSATAFLCMSDMLAIGTMQALRHLGRRVPQDYSIVGYDGLELTEYTDPPLTTVDQNIFEKGYKAAQVLHSRIRGERVPNRVVLPHTLAIRGSVRNI